MEINRGVKASMAKRFIDSDLFKKGFFRSLDAPSKLLWVYLFTDCNHAGVWECDFEVASIRVGQKITAETLTQKFKDKVVFFDGNSKVFIPSYIEFQYGEDGLSEKNSTHKNIIPYLKKYGFLDDKNKVLITPLKRGLEALKDMDKDKEEDKDKDFGKSENLLNDPQETSYPTFDDFWNAYQKKRGRAPCEKIWKKISQSDKEKIIPHVQEYVAATPDIQYRKDPATYLNQKSWNDEIIKNDGTNSNKRNNEDPTHESGGPNKNWGGGIPAGTFERLL